MLGSGVPRPLAPGLRNAPRNCFREFGQRLTRGHQTFEMRPPGSQHFGPLPLSSIMCQAPGPRCTAGSFLPQQRTKEVTCSDEGADVIKSDVRSLHLTSPLTRCVTLNKYLPLSGPDFSSSKYLKILIQNMSWSYRGPGSPPSTLRVFLDCLSLRGPVAKHFFIVKQYMK